MYHSFLKKINCVTVNSPLTGHQVASPDLHLIKQCLADRSGGIIIKFKLYKNINNKVIRNLLHIRNQIQAQIFQVLAPLLIIGVSQLTWNKVELDPYLNIIRICIRFIPCGSLPIKFKVFIRIQNYQTRVWSEYEPK